MSNWICCNSCFYSPSAGRRLAVTSCGHVICSVCYQKGKQGKCLICNANCQVSPLSDNSSSEVKALFSDINVVATKHFTEISKVIMFQARHQKRLLTYHRQKTEKLEDTLVKMKQEMLQMTKKLNEQSAYITKLENSLHHQSAKVSSVPQMSHSCQTPRGHKSVLQIPFNSPMSLSRHSSVTNFTENMELEERSLFRKSSTAPRLSLMCPPHNGRIGMGSALTGPHSKICCTVSHRSSSQNVLAKHSACSVTASRFQGSPVNPEASYSQSSGWNSPIFRPPSSFRHSMSSLVCPPP